MSTGQWKCSVSDLDLTNATPVGAGALSYVLRTQHLPTKATVAVKVLSKVQLLQQGKVEAVMNEKNALYELGPHPFITRLYGTAQSDDELYFVLEYLPHGDLLQHIRTVASDRTKRRNELLARGETVPASFRRCLTFPDIQLIAAQLVTALAHCFSKGYVLRDLKPENIVFDDACRCCIIDFDTVVKDAELKPHTNHGKAVKDRDPEQEKRRKTVSEIQAMRRNTSHFCGTAQYVSPEMVGECHWSYCSDLWALGVILYQCLYGTYPFRGANTFTVMKKLIQGVRPEKHFAEVIDVLDEPGDDSEGHEQRNRDAFERLKHFISSLLRVDPTLRLGVNPITLKFEAAQLTSHPVFDGFDWSVVHAQVRDFSFPGPDEALRRLGSANQEAGSSSEQSVAQPQQQSVMSFSTIMRDVPSHSDEYASFVFRASSAVNPFEEWSHRSLEGTDSGVCDPSQVELDSDDEAILNPNANAQSSNSAESDDEEADDTSSDDDNVYDDVGEQKLTTQGGDFRR